MKPALGVIHTSRDHSTLKCRWLDTFHELVYNQYPNASDYCDYLRRGIERQVPPAAINFVKEALQEHIQ